MKKLILFTFLVVLLASSVLAFNADVAYVVKGSTNSVFINELNTAGLTYDIIYETQVTSTDFSQYEMILVGDDKFDNPNDIPVNQYNSLLANSYHFYKKGISPFANSQWGWSNKKGMLSSPSNLEINSGVTSSIIDGIPSNFQAYNSANVDVKTYYLTSTKANGIDFLIHAGGTSHTENDAVIAIAPPGTIYLNGNIGQGRSVFFGVSYPNDWTSNSQQLFRNSLNWVLIGEDQDNDGFYSDLDCDDNDAGINPNATDIAYDKIDQNCNGYDLADVDGDDYCKEGYEIQNALSQCPNEEGILGTDCQDENANAYPGSPNLSLNCINDAPIISTVPNFIIKESQSVILSISATDPENDNLTYFVNDSKFTQTNINTFLWQTGFYDAGEHVFNAIVSDGQLNATKSFKVTISEKNQAPILNTTIPDQTWNEDTNLSLNLSDYFSDPDPLNNLTFGVSETSTDTSISILSIINGIASFIVEQDWNGFDWIIFFASDGEEIVESNNVTLTVSPVNDAPILAIQIPDQTWDEDTPLILNFSEYFTDIDSELNYSVIGNPQININLSNNLATFIPVKDWNGKETIKINASDGEFSVLSNEFNLIVLPMNDAPVLDFINDELILAGEFVDINQTATDVDGDNLSFSFSLPLNQMGQWQTSEQDAGIYKILVNVNDGNGGIDSQQFSIQVLQKFYINEFVSNPATGNEWIELYNGFNQIINISNCVVKDGANNIFNLEGELGQKGFTVIEMNNKLNNLGDILILYCSDKLIDSVTYGNWNDGDISDNAEVPGIGESASRNPDGLDTNNNFEDFEIFKYPTKGLESNTDMIAPVVQLLNPSDNTLFTEKRDITFEFIVTENLAETLECDVYLNDSLKATNKDVKNNTVKEIIVTDIPDGGYNWNIRCYDQVNYAFAQDNKTISINAPDSPILNPIGEKFVNENETLEFKISATDPDSNNLSFSIQNTPLGAGLVDNLDGTATFSWTPNYEQAGNYDIIFIVKDSNNLLDQETIKISVNNQRIPPKFSDISLCENKNPNLELSIERPNDGDEFKLGEKIRVKTEIKNNYNEDLDVDLEVYLYDIDDEEIVTKEKENGIDVDVGESEKISLDLMVPEDIDIEDKDFAIFVLGEGDDEIFCNEQFIYIDIQRKEHEIVIENFLIEEFVAAGNNFEVTVEIQNLGEEDEDVHVEIKNSEFGTLEKSEEFVLEKYGDLDKKTQTFTIQMPPEAKEGSYDLEIKVIADHTQDSKTGTINVIEQEIVTQTQKNIIYLADVKKEAVTQQNGVPIYLVILILISMLIVVAKFIKN